MDVIEVARVILAPSSKRSRSDSSGCKVKNRSPICLALSTLENSVLSAVAREFAGLSGRLGVSDKNRSPTNSEMQEMLTTLAARNILRFMRTISGEADEPLYIMQTRGYAMIVTYLLTYTGRW
jgi:hypothetical protein